MSWLRLVRVVRMVCGLVVAAAAGFSLLGFPADAGLWSGCLRGQRCAELLPRSIPALDAGASWSVALLLLGVALLLPDRWWRALGGAVLRHDPRALQIVFDPEANAQADEAGKVVACTVSIYNAGRRRVSGLTVMLTAWFIDGRASESDTVILASLRRRPLVPSHGAGARARYSLGGRQHIDFHVASVRKDEPGYLFTFGDALGDADTPVKAASDALPVPAGRYRVLIRAQGRWTPPVDRYFLLTLERNEITMVGVDRAG